MSESLEENLKAKEFVESFEPFEPFDETHTYQCTEASHTGNNTAAAKSQDTQSNETWRKNQIGNK